MELKTRNALDEVTFHRDDLTFLRFVLYIAGGGEFSYGAIQQKARDLYNKMCEIDGIEPAKFPYK